MKLKTLIALWVGLIAIAFTSDNSIKVYLIISSRGGEYTIEKVYLKKENAQKYCDQFKDSHNYTIEEKILSE